jgi:hypothetical protein
MKMFHSQRRVYLRDPPEFSSKSASTAKVGLAYALYALSRGASAEDAGAAIRSRDLSHKGTERRQEDYVERTIRKALALQRSQARER